MISKLEIVFSVFTDLRSVFCENGIKQRVIKMTAQLHSGFDKMSSLYFYC